MKFLPVKKAAGPLSPTLQWRASHLRPDAASQLVGKKDAARQLLQILGIGAVGGFGARAIREFDSMSKEKDTPVMPTAMIPQTFSFNALPKQAGLKDMANSAVDAAKSFGSQFTMDNAVNKLAPMLPASTTSEPLLNDWGIPASIVAGTGATYGGYKLLDWLLQANKQHSQTGELDDAEKDYETALSEQYRAAMQPKRASDDLGIDQLFEKLGFLGTLSSIEATAPGNYLGEMYDNVVGHDTHQLVKGIQNAAAMLMAAGVGKATYDHTRARNQNNLVDEALIQRQRERQKLSPPPLLALPRREPDPEPAVAGY